MGGQAATVGRKISGPCATEAGMPYQKLHFRHPIPYTVQFSVLQPGDTSQPTDGGAAAVADGCVAAAGVAVERQGKCS